MQHVMPRQIWKPKQKTPVVCMIHPTEKKKNWLGKEGEKTGGGGGGRTRKGNKDVSEADLYCHDWVAF